MASRAVSWAAQSQEFVGWRLQAWRSCRPVCVQCSLLRMARDRKRVGGGQGNHLRTTTTLAASRQPLSLARQPVQPPGTRVREGKGKWADGLGGFHLPPWPRLPPPASGPPTPMPPLPRLAAQFCKPPGPPLNQVRSEGGADLPAVACMHAFMMGSRASCGGQGSGAKAVPVRPAPQQAHVLEGGFAVHAALHQSGRKRHCPSSRTWCSLLPPPPRPPRSASPQPAPNHHCLDSLSPQDARVGGHACGLKACNPGFRRTKHLSTRHAMSLPGPGPGPAAVHAGPGAWGPRRHRPHVSRV